MPNLPKLSKESAIQIKQRFQAILDAIDKGVESIRIKIGCPHCELAYKKAEELGDLPIKYNCIYCDYPPIKGITGFQCCNYVFNGVNYFDVNQYLILSDSSISLNSYWREKETEIRSFCQGHIDWAEEYLQ